MAQNDEAQLAPLLLAAEILGVKGLGIDFKFSDSAGLNE